METKNKYVKIRVVRQETARELDIDPAELWLDQDIEPEALIELDPFEVTPEVLDAADQPELADPLLTSLRRRRWSICREEAWLRKLRAQMNDAEARQKLAQLVKGSK